MKRKAIFLICILLAGILGGCGPKEQAQIAATTLPVYTFTTRLCQGTGLTVTRVVTDSVSCLHDYSLSVRQVQAIEGADLVVISGAGLESFMEDILHDAPNVIDSSTGVHLLGCDTEHEHEHEHDHDHAHHDHETDSHIWLSPLNAKLMATNICEGLIANFPSHAEVFQANLSALNEELDRLYDYGLRKLSQLSCREMITFHDGFAYLADAFDLTILEAIEEESGSEASAHELIHLIETVEAHHLPAVFTERNGSASAADIICAETGIRSLPLDMAMSGDDYFQAMYHNIDTLKEALG